jgi:hypothetical protein
MASGDQQTAEEKEYPDAEHAAPEMAGRHFEQGVVIAVAMGHDDQQSGGQPDEIEIILSPVPEVVRKRLTFI